MIVAGSDLGYCSGLVLLIREQMLKTPVDGILERRSREPSVADDLPSWCGMAGHAYPGKVAGEGFSLGRYFLRRGSTVKEDYRPNQVFLATDCGSGCCASRSVNVENLVFRPLGAIVAAARIPRQRHG